MPKLSAKSTTEKDNSSNRNPLLSRNSTTRSSTPGAALLIDREDQVRYDKANEEEKRVRASLRGHLNRGEHISVTDPDAVGQYYYDEMRCKQCIENSKYCWTEKTDTKNCVECLEADLKCVLPNEKKTALEEQKKPQTRSQSRSKRKSQIAATRSEATVTPNEEVPVDTSGELPMLGNDERESGTENEGAKSEEATPVDAPASGASNSEEKDTAGGTDASHRSDDSPGTASAGTSLQPVGHANEVPTENATLTDQLYKLCIDIDKMLSLNLSLLKLSQSSAKPVQSIEYPNLTSRTEHSKDVNDELDDWAKKSAEFDLRIRMQKEEQITILAKRKEGLEEMNMKIAALAGRKTTELRERSQQIEKMKKDLENLEKEHEQRIEKLEREMGKEAEQLSVVLRGKSEATLNKRKASLGEHAASSIKRTKAD